MPSLVDYQVLQDSGLEMRDPPQAGTPDHVIWNWVRPDNLHISSAMARSPILSMKVRVFEKTSLTVMMNGQPVVDGSDLAPDNVKVWWEVISFRTAFPSGSSLAEVEPIEMRLDGGHIRVSDAVFWFQINV